MKIFKESKRHWSTIKVGDCLTDVVSSRTYKVVRFSTCSELCAKCSTGGQHLVMHRDEINGSRCIIKSQNGMSYWKEIEDDPR